MTFNNDNQKPRCVVSFEGGELEDSDSRFESCTIDDHAGYQNDTAEVSLSNNPYVEYPPQGTEFTVKMGFGDTENLVTMGIYTVDEIKDTGPPDRIIVCGHAIDTDSQWKEIRFATYTNVSVGDIARAVINRNGGRPIVDPFFDSVMLSYKAQRAQSDQDFLTKLADEYKGMMKPLLRNVYFIRKGQKLDATPKFTIYKTQVAHHDYQLQGRSNFGIVVARWRDTNTGKETALAIQSGLETSKSAFVMPKIYATETAARFAANSQAQAFYGSRETFEFTMWGVPGLVAESDVVTSGFHPQQPTDWRVIQVSHSITKGSGYVTTAHCELPEVPLNGFPLPPALENAIVINGQQPAR